LAQREKARMKKPKHLGEGLFLGVTSIGKGVVDGVQGMELTLIFISCKESLLSLFRVLPKMVSKDLSRVLSKVSQELLLSLLPVC